MADNVPLKSGARRPFGGRRGGLAGIWALLGALALPGDARGQDAPKNVQDPDGEAREKDLLNQLDRFLAFEDRFHASAEVLVFDQETGYSHVLFWGNVHGSYVWKGELVRVWADRILVLRNEKADKPQETASYYAEGGVRIETSGGVLEADAFYHDHQRERGVAIQARGRGRLEEITRIRKLFQEREFSFLGTNGPGLDVTPTMSGTGAREAYPRWRVERRAGPVPRAEIPGRERRRSAIQMAFRAEVLRLTDVLHFDGEGVTLSTCEYGEPHWALHFDGIHVTRVVDRDASAEGEGEQATDLPPEQETREDRREAHRVDTEGAWLQFRGLSLIPFPLGYWDTDWIDLEYNPIRDLSYSSSGKYGDRVDVDWNLNWILEKLPGSNLEPVEEFLDSSRLDVQTDYMSKRGFGYGATGIYGEHPLSRGPWDPEATSWDYYGRGLYYRIDDEGSDRTGPAGAPDIDDLRWWGNVIHRQSIPRLGVLDIEFSERSDENFLNEYYPETRVEKEQENLFYLRRNFLDNIALTGLYKYQRDEFETTVERLPEAKLFVFEQPVFDSGFYTSLAAQAAHLRHRPDEDLIENSRRYGRLDALNEWSFPFGLRDYLRVRPFVGARWTVYETGADPADHSIDRESLHAGVVASQEWSRVFSMDRGGWVRRWLGFDAVKHSIIPKVSYFNRFENTVDPSRLFQVDEVDGIDRLEAVGLSLRNVLWGRRVDRTAARRALERTGWGQWESAQRDRGELMPLPTTTRAVLDAELSTTWFPQPARDNGGDRFSLADVDVGFYPSRYLSVRSRNFFDPNEDFEYRLTDNSLTVEPLPRVLRLTVGERFRRGVSEFLYGQLAVELGSRYSLEAYYGWDLDDDDRTDVEVRLIRFMHRFALETSYSFDAGERDNHTVSFNFYPVEMFDSFWERRGRFDYAAGLGDDDGR